MKNFKKNRWVIVCAGVALIFSAWFALRGARTESIENAPVVSAGSSILNPQSALTYFEDKVRHNPEHTGYRLALAQSYLQYAVETRQEPAYLPKAERVLKDILKSSPDHYEAQALQASLYNSLHQFEKARDIAYSLIERDGNRAYVYGILVDALVELGSYDEAVLMCDRMLGIKPGLTSYARAAYLRELHGDSDGAKEAMRLAAGAGVVGSAERSWALYQLGQLYLAENDLQTAALIFEGILEEKPGYAFALGGLAQVHLLNEEYDAALQRFESAYDRVPAGEFLEGMLEAYIATGEEAKRAATLEAIEASYMEADKMGENVRMEYADFLVDLNKNIPEALEFARIEYERRPSHLHALETYAWALHKSGRSEEAQQYIEEAMRLGNEDAMVFFRAAHIYQSSNQTQTARLYLREALDANLHVESPSAAREAQVLFDSLS